MSRYYEMNVRVEKFDRAKTLEIEDALGCEWDFDNLLDTAGSLDREPEIDMSGRGNLCGGETEDAFARRAAAAAMKANGGPCEVVVVASYLEDPPTETYAFGATEYDALMKIARADDEPDESGATP